MSYSEGSTIQLNNRFSSCEGIDDLKELMDSSRALYTEWRSYIRQIVDFSGLSYQRFGDLCGVSKTAVIGWCNHGKLPQNRNTFIRIGLAVNMELDDINHLLQRYGKYPKLYAKNIEDAICIYCITHPENKAFSSKYDYIEYLKERFVSGISSDYSSGNAQKSYDTPTHRFLSTLTYMENEEELERFIRENLDIFRAVNIRLVKYIDSFISASVKAADPQCASPSLHAFVEQKNLNACFERMILQLRKHRLIPRRERLIALGIHMNMTLDEMNYMLGLANMESLCAKDKIECVIIYAVESAYLNNPIHELENAMLLRQYTEDGELRERCDKVIMEHYAQHYHYDESNEDLTEQVSDYVRSVLNSLDIAETESLLGLV